MFYSFKNIKRTKKMQCLYCQKNIQGKPWNHLTNMLDWADRESPWHSEMVGMFGSEIEQSLNGSNGRAYDDAGKTKDELRETIMECKQEIIEKTEILCNEYIEVLNKVEY